MRTSKIYYADFETTTYKNIKSTEVWASALVGNDDDEIFIDLSIEAFFRRLFKIKANICCYFHNLKFDGSFILNYLFKRRYKYCEQTKKNDLEHHSFTTLINNTGQWYTITLKHNNQIIEFRDSLKILPFSIKNLAESFSLPISKGEIDYTKHKKSGEAITTEEYEYIKNDVLILKECVKKMIDEGHKRLTIGSCCLSEYRKIISESEYKRLFPSHDDIEIHGINADSWVRESYRGGWCYLKHGCGNKIFKGGKTMDVNSLYPYVMSFNSGYKYPTGNPHPWMGVIPDFLINNDNYYYFIKLKCRFKLRPNKLPFIQIKHDYNYKSNEHLKTSDFYIEKEQRYSRYKYVDGILKDSTVTLTLTETDYKLFKECYYIYDEEIIEGVYYNAERGMFDRYINKYRKIKENSVGAQRTIAKLFSNNLYGKMATSRDSSYKVPQYTCDGLVFNTVYEENKSSGYIPIGSAITSNARDYTIRHAIKNYKNFIYADTDSLHMTGSKFNDIEEDSKEYGKWKCEFNWNEAIFIRQKTYVEKNNDIFDIKACGCPDMSKQYIKEIIKNNLSLFKRGLSVKGKLMPKQINGGCVLIETDFTIK